MIEKNIDHFRKTFQKPCRIYRYISERWKTNPLYLNRTLSYVSKHRDRPIRKRDTSLEAIVKRLHKNHQELSDRLGTDKYNVAVQLQHYKQQLKAKIIPSGNNVKTGSREVNEIGCYFNWVCDDKARTTQKTKSKGFTCPWCLLDMKHLDTLMMHLKCCHPRFNFKLFSEGDDGDHHSVIDMSLNASFDPSYCGFKYPGHDLRRDFRFTPLQPERRTPFSQVIYFKSRRRKEFSPFECTNGNGIQDDQEADIDVCSGRLYYHTSTCLPIKPNEVDIDSEADMDPEWLKERTQLMIDEFTDVNEGEKEILKIWNLYIMNNFKYKSDKMIRDICLEFVENEGPTIVNKNLTRNFILHLANLYDFGLLGSSDLLDFIRRIQGLKRSLGRVSGKAKHDRNEHCQHSPPAKRALLNSHCN